MRSLAFLPFLLLGACGTDDSPPTSPGHLLAITDHQDTCDDSADAPDFACNVQITLDGDHVTALGVYNDGRTTGGPAAAGQLTPAAAAELARLIAHFPLDTGNTIQTEGCGFQLPRTTDFTIDFDDGEHRTFAYQYSTVPAVRDLFAYSLRLIDNVKTCTGDSLSLAGCDPYLTE